MSSRNDHDLCGPTDIFTDSGDRWLNLFDSALVVFLVSTLISLSIMGLVLRRQVDWVKLIAGYDQYD